MLRLLIDNMSRCLEIPYSFESAGIKLSGFVHIPSNFNPPVTILLHGFTGSKVEAGRLFVRLARKLCNMGICVIRFDYRGHGDSPLSFEEFRMSWAIEDSENVLSHIVNRGLEGFKVDNDKVGLIGLSMGGFIAAYLAAYNPKDVSALCLLSPAIDFSEIITERIARLAKDDFVYLGSMRMRWKAFVDMRKYNAMEFAERIRAPTLIIHSMDDIIVPYAQALHFFKILKCKKRLLTISRGGHTFEVFEEREKVIKEACAWMEKWLLAPNHR